MDVDAQWCAGLFVGEGSAGVARRKSSARIICYPALQLGMCDERAVKAFAEFFGFKYNTYPRGEFRDGHKVHITHRRAVDAFNTMWPYLRESDKGDQIQRVLVECGYSYDASTELWSPPEGRRSEGMKGNTNAKGKHWNLSDETKQRQAAARRRR